MRHWTLAIFIMYNIICTCICTYIYIITVLFFTLLAPSSNRSSLSNQFIKQQRQKSVAVGNSSLFTEQSLSPLVTNSQSASLGKESINDQIFSNTCCADPGSFLTKICSYSM